MSNKKKNNILRIGALISIAMFLLIPLMSSPVAAAFNLTLGSVTTNNLPGGPTATGSISTPGSVSDTSPYNALFNVQYFYSDNHPTGWGSDHWITLSIRWLPGGNLPWSGPVTRTQPTITRPAGSGQLIGWYTATPPINNYGGKQTVFEVTVIVHCKDTASGFTQTWTSTTQTFTIV